MREEIFDLKLKGYCCSQILMEMGLRKLGKDNPDLIAAMAGLCDGVQCGKTCGIVSAAICLLYLADPKEASQGLTEDFLGWFEDAFGNTECEALIGDDPLNKVELCGMMLDASFTQLEELLEWDE